LIVRREKDSLRSYIHFSTGNYNDSTAKSYTDISLMSCDPDLTADAATLFNLLSGGAEPPEKWCAINAAPFDLRKKLVRLIKAEIAKGPQGRIIAKMNSFSDPQLVNLIHRAADAGVEIDLIVRGICCCRPKAGQKNLRIISIIDRYLEHSRIFYFGSEDQLFCSSADWMPRNLDRRVETMFPIRDPQHKKTIMAMLDMHLADRCQQRRLTASGKYIRPRNNRQKKSRSQYNIYKLFKKSADSAADK
jgi:polyphosphate kinase